MEDLTADNSSYMKRNTESSSLTEVTAIKHTHTWIVKTFSCYQNKFLQTMTTVTDLDMNNYPFRVKLHLRGGKSDTFKDFCFFQADTELNLKYTAKFTVSNSAGNEIPTTIRSRKDTKHVETVLRSQLLNHIAPDDEVKIVLSLTIVPGQIPRSITLPILPKDIGLNALSKNLADHLLNKKFTDFTIRCRGEYPPIRCHRFILSSRSPVFNAILADDTDEFQRGEMFFNDIDYLDMKHFIFYLYSGKIPRIESFDVAFEMLKLACRFEVSELKELSEISVRFHISVENVCKILKVADMYQVLSLRAECIRYIANNISDVMKIADWIDLTNHQSELITEITNQKKDDTNFKSALSDDTSIDKVCLPEII